MKSLRLTRVILWRLYCRDELDGADDPPGEPAELPDTWRQNTILLLNKQSTELIWSAWKTQFTNASKFDILTKKNKS